MPNCKVPLDHIVIVVPDLCDAVKKYQLLGFTVTLGGRNGPTHNALIAFEDSTYIELIAPRSFLSKRILRLINWFSNIRSQSNSAETIKHRLLRWFDGRTGFQDWCLRGEELSNASRLLSNAGIPCTDIASFRRLKPNGQQVKWNLMAPLDLQLPFLIEDQTDIAVRVPFGADVCHALAATGISEIHLPANYRDCNLPALSANLSGKNTCEAKMPAQLNLSANSLPAGECLIVLASSTNKSRTLHIQSSGSPVLLDS